MDIKKIDLSQYNGVTILLKLKGGVPGHHYYISVKEPGKKLIFYERIYNQDKVSINLPKHTKEVNLIVLGDTKIKNYILTKLRKANLPFRIPLKTKRPFNIADLQIRNNHNMRSPARFHVNEPLIEFNPKKMEKYNQGIRYYISLHELGHHYFDEEELADRWATIQFLNDGYNLSTANYALTQALSKNPINLNRMVTQGEYLNYINQLYT